MRDVYINPFEWPDLFPAHHLQTQSISKVPLLFQQGTARPLSHIQNIFH